MIYNVKRILPRNGLHGFWRSGKNPIFLLLKIQILYRKHKDLYPVDYVHVG